MKTSFLLFYCLIATFSVSVAANPIDSEKLFSSPYMTVKDFSPDGRFLFTIVNEPKKRFIALFEIEMGEMYSIITLGSNANVERFEWLSPHKFFIRTKLQNKTVEYIATLAFKEKEKEKDKEIEAELTEIKEKGFLVDFVASNSSQVLYAKQIPHENAGYELFLIDIDDLLAGKIHTAQKIGIPRGANTYFFYDKITKRIFSSVYDQSKDTLSFYYRTFEDPDWRKFLIVEDNEDVFSPIGFLDDNTLAVLSNSKHDKVSLHEFDITSQTIGKLIYGHPEYDLVTATLSEDNNAFSVGFYEKGRFTVEYLSDHKDLLNQRINETFPDTQWHYVAKFDEKNLRVFKTYGSDEPGSYYLYNGQTDTAELISHRYPDLAQYSFSQTQVFTVTSDDGEQLEGYLNLPIGPSHNVLIVMPHGGPIGVRESDGFNENVQYLADRGYAVLRVNFRGSTGFGKSFMAEAVGEFGDRIEKDILSVLGKVKADNKFDYTCAIGTSYGGYSSTMLAIEYPDDFDCVVAAFGIYDLPLLFNESVIKTQDDYIESITRVVGENSEKLFARSPVYLSKKLTKPTMLIAGYNDNIAPIEHSFRLKYTLDRHGHTPETLFYEKTGHGHVSWYWERHQSAATDDFLVRTLNLKPLWKDRKDETSATLAKDAIILADSYNFNDIVGNDFDKAFHNYEVAASFDEPRATYNIGSFYYDGNSVETDFVKAKQYFQKAADMNYPTAFLILADMYKEGLGVDKNLKEAFDYTERAIDAKKGAIAYVALAEFYCFGEVVVKDIATCFKYLSLNSYHKDEALKKVSGLSDANSRRKKVLARIITNLQLSSQETEDFYKMLEQEIRVLPNDIDIKVKEYGYWDDDKIVQSSTFDTSVEQRIGVIFDISPKKLLTKKSTRNALVVRWSKIDEDENEVVLYSDLFWGAGMKGWSVNYNVQENWPVNSRVRVELFDIGGQKILEQFFSPVVNSYR